MRKNIFEKSEKFFAKAGTFLNFDPVLYMESKKRNKKNQGGKHFEKRGNRNFGNRFRK